MDSLDDWWDPRYLDSIATEPMPEFENRCRHCTHFNGRANYCRIKTEMVDCSTTELYRVIPLPVRRNPEDLACDQFEEDLEF